MKRLELKKLVHKLYKLDYEAGSGKLHSEMKSIDTYYFIVDNFRYPIGKELFDSANEGDELYFCYAPLSNELLSIELKKTRNIWG